jgi:hypothetical protein
MKKLLIIAVLFTAQAHAEKIIKFSDASECVTASFQLKSQGYKSIDNVVFVDINRMFSKMDTVQNGKYFVKLKCYGNYQATVYTDEEFKQFVDIQNFLEQITEKKINQQLKEIGVL